MSLLKSSGGSATGLLGKQSAPKDLGYDAKLILVPEDAEIATKTLALTESTWLDAINSAVGTRYIVLPINYDIESSPEDDVYATSSLGSVEFVREGKDTVKYSVIVSPFVMKQARTLNGVDWKVYITTSGGFLKGTSTDDTKFLPFTLDNFRVEKEVKATGDTPATLPISITYANPDEWTSSPAFAEPLKEGVGDNWNPRDLKDPKAISIKEVTLPAITGFTVAIEGYDEVPHEGAVTSDFGIWDTSGALVSISSVTEQVAVPGTYDVLATLVTSTTYTTGLLPVGSPATLGYATLVADRADVVVP